MRDRFEEADFGSRVSGWPEHWTNGGTGVTKFDAKDRSIYEVAIKESGRTDLFLKGNELHRNGRRDTGDFYDVWYRLKAEADAQRVVPAPQSQPEGNSEPATPLCDCSDECRHIPCGRCGKKTVFDGTYGDLCGSCCRASNE